MTTRVAQVSTSTLAEICELIVDCEHKTAAKEKDGYPSIRTPNIGRGYIILNGVNRVSEETYKEWTSRAVPAPGDLMLAREAPVGNVAIIPPGLKVCLGQRTVLIRPDRSRVNPRYLMYFLLSNQIQAKLQSLTAGATVSHLNMRDIRSLEIPELPSRSVQLKIASILSAYDDLIENNLRRINILEEMAQLLYREWFVKFRFPGHEKVRMVDSPLGKIPEGWEFRNLGSLCELRKDKYRDQHATLPLLNMARMLQCTLAVGEMGRPEELATSRILFEKDDILFGSIRIYLHKVALAPCTGVTNISVFVIRPVAEELKAFLTVLLCSAETIRWADQHSTGTKMPVIKWEILKKMPVLKPGRALLESFEALIQPMLQTIQISCLRNRILRQTRDLLLPKLISGELDISELDIKVREDL